MSCVEQMKYKLYLERTSFKDAREYIEKNSEEVYYVDPGYKIFKDYYIIGVPPVAMGVQGKGDALHLRQALSRHLRHGHRLRGGDRQAPGK